MIRLNIIEDDEEEARVFTGSSVVIGRSRSCDLTFRHAGFLSRQHCCLRIQNGTLKLEDMKSRNGLRVNGRPFVSGEDRGR